MFKKLETVTSEKHTTPTGSHGVIYKGKVKTFSLNVSEIALRRAKLTIGDRVAISLGEANDKSKWLILEQASNGYKVLPVQSQKLASGKRVNIDGQYARGLLKTTKVETFLEKYFFDSPKDWSDNEIKTQGGMIAFPLEQTKKAWF